MDPRIRYVGRTFYRIPFLDPYWGRGETLAAFGREDESRARERLAIELGVRGFEHVVLTGSGRCGLELALSSLPRGEVIVPSLICGSVVQAIINARKRPVFVDVKFDLSISADSVRDHISADTVAIVVPHLSGIVCSDFDEIVELAASAGIAVVDDAAQALGIRFKGRHLGTLGDFGLLSFGVGKPTFSIGGGALVCRTAQAAAGLREQLSERAETGRHPGVAPLRFVAEYNFRRYSAPFFLAARAFRKGISASGTTARCRRIRADEAAIQTVRMRKLDAIVRAFGERTATIVAAAGHGPFEFPQISKGTTATKLVVRSLELPTRELFRRLLKRGIETEWWYTPAENRSAFARFRRGRNPTAESLAPQLLVIPNHPGLSTEQATYVGRSLRQAFDAI